MATSSFFSRRYKVIMLTLFMVYMKNYCTHFQIILVGLLGGTSWIYQQYDRQKPPECGLNTILEVDLKYIFKPVFDVIYYSPNCGHCQKILPILKEHLMMNQVPIYFIDAYNQRVQVKTPTLKRYICSEEVVEVSGAEAVLTFLQLNLDVV